MQNINIKLDCVEGHTNMQITLSDDDVYFYKKKNREPRYTTSDCTTIATRYEHMALQAFGRRPLDD